MSDVKTYGRYKNRSGRLGRSTAPPAQEWQISKDIEKFYSVKEAADYLSAKGISLTAYTIRRRCSTRKWQEGVFWVKPIDEYLIDAKAVFEAVTRGESI